ncbi:hypothetical protein GCM10028819_51300 [Spirosoma humi]
MQSPYWMRQWMNQPIANWSADGHDKPAENKRVLLLGLVELFVSYIFERQSIRKGTFGG